MAAMWSPRLRVPNSSLACSMLYHLLLHTVKTQQSAGVSPGQPHFLQFDIVYDKDAEEAANNLSQAASGGSLYVIADEAWYRPFKTFCDKLLTQVPHLHLWAASCDHGHAPAGWQVEYLTRPLRSPPTVVREVAKHREIAYSGCIRPYSERGVPDHTDGPPVIQLYHRDHGHSGNRPDNCVECGREVANFLRSLRVGVTEYVTTTATNVTSTCGGTTPPCLQWRDVLVLNCAGVHKGLDTVKGLKEAGIPLRLMTDDDIEDVATARSDVVWMMNGDLARGLERKVVVCVNVDVHEDVYLRPHYISRCTSQLVIVSR